MPWKRDFEICALSIYESAFVPSDGIFLYSIDEMEEKIVSLCDEWSDR